jgi:hypothetical protein
MKSALVGTIVLSLAGYTAAEPKPEGTPLALRATVRGVAGVDSRAGFGLGLISFGGDLHLSPSLTLGGQLVGQTPFGSIDAGAPAAFGFGGELTLRAMLLSDSAVVRPYLTWNLGIALFAGRPFLPGGDIYDFLVGGGVGAEVSLTRACRLGVEGFMLHESNGQGLGPFNPAFDGFGTAVTMTWSDGAIVTLTGVPRARPGGRTTRFPGVSLDAVAGVVGHDALGTGRLLAAQRLADPVLVVADLEYGAFAGERLIEGGGALVLHLDESLSAGAHLGYRDYAGLGTTVGAGQLEWHATPAASLVGLVHVERNVLDGTRWRAGFGLRTYVRDSLMVLVGLGFNDLTAPDQSFEDSSNPFVGFEWRLPIAGAGWQVSLYGERRISTFDVAGLRFGWNMGDTPRDSARHDAWRRLL